MKKGLKASLSPQGYLGESPNPNMNFQFMPTSVGSELCSKVTCSNLMKHIVSCDVSRSGLLSSHRCWYNTTFAAPWPSEVTAQVGLINNWIYGKVRFKRLQTVRQFTVTQQSNTKIGYIYHYKSYSDHLTD